MYKTFQILPCTKHFKFYHDVFN